MDAVERTACTRQQELIGEVVSRLQRLVELPHAESKALQKGRDESWKKIDQEIEMVMGEKERCIGALNEHRSEHGC